MNDISVKIVESHKDIVAVSPSTLAGAENDLDPLAIEEAEVGVIKDPLVDEEPFEKFHEEKAGNCDDNAKEKIVTESQNEDSNKVIAGQIDSKKEDVQDDTLITIKVTEEPPASSNEPDRCNETPELPEDQEVKPQTSDPKPVVVPDPVAPIPEKKEPIPTKEVQEEIKSQELDVDMNDVAKIEERTEQKFEEKPKTQPMNGDISKDDRGTKRPSSEDVETESPLKKLCAEVEKTFPHHDTMINDYVQTATRNNVDEIQRHTEQLLAEIQTLRELAQKKEQEWNNILHLKKVKEEILLRLLRRKQVLSFEKSAEVNGQDPFDYLNQVKNLAIDKSDEISGLAIKNPGSSMNPMMQTPVMPVTSHFNPMSGLPPPYDKAHLQNMPKPVFPQPLMMPGPMPGFPRDMNGQLPNFGHPMGRQGPTKDVKSIIADYRQRNPEITPRRGRRMKSLLNPNMMNQPRPIAPKMDMNNLNNLNMFFNSMDMNQKAVIERLQQGQSGGLQNGMSNKDELALFANMQHNPEFMPMFTSYLQNQQAVIERLQQGQSAGLQNGMSNKDAHAKFAKMQQHPDFMPMLTSYLQNQKALMERLQQGQSGGLQNGMSFKDVLVQFANMQHNPNFMPNRPMEPPNRPEHHIRPEGRRRPEKSHEEPPHKPAERLSSPSPRLPPPPPYPEISLLPVTTAQETSHNTQNSLLHGILTKQGSPATQSYSPTLAKLLTSPERKQGATSLPTYGQAKNCGEITITPVQPTPPPAEPQPEKTEEVVQLDDEESPASEGEASGSPSGSGSGRLVIDEGGNAEPSETQDAGESETPLCQGCRRRDAQFVCAGCANQWYCSRDCQVAAWDEHSEMCSG